MKEEFCFMCGGSGEYWIAADDTYSIDRQAVCSHCFGGGFKRPPAPARFVQEATQKAVEKIKEYFEIRSKK